MVRQIISEQDTSDAGITPAEVVGHVDGHEFDNDLKTVIVIENTGAGAHTVTIPTPMTVNGLAVADRTYVMAAGDKLVAGPFQRQLYEQSGHKIWVNFDASPAEVLCSYVKVGPPA